MGGSSVLGVHSPSLHQGKIAAGHDQSRDPNRQPNDAENARGCQHDTNDP
jgi:hypothetical protein